MKLGLGLVLVTAALGCTSADEERCDTVGACRRDLTATAALTVSVVELDGATVEACRGTVCTASTLALAKGPSVDTVRCESTLQCSGEARASGVRLDLRMELQAAEPVDGESYTFRVTTKAGGTVLAVTKPVTFVREEASCGCANTYAELSLP